MLPFLSEKSGWMRIHRKGGKHCCGEPSSRIVLLLLERGREEEAKGPYFAG